MIITFDINELFYFTIETEDKTIISDFNITNVQMIIDKVILEYKLENKKHRIEYDKTTTIGELSNFISNFRLFRKLDNKDKDCKISDYRIHEITHLLTLDKFTISIINDETKFDEEITTIKLNNLKYQSIPHLWNKTNIFTFDGYNNEIIKTPKRFTIETTDDMLLKKITILYEDYVECEECDKYECFQEYGETEENTCTCDELGTNLCLLEEILDETSTIGTLRGHLDIGNDDILNKDKISNYRLYKIVDTINYGFIIYMKKEKLIISALELTNLQYIRTGCKSANKIA
jgi:hypothetical protein